MTVTADEDVLAEPRPCARCSQPSLLWVAGRCADCIAQLGLQDDSAEYRSWKDDVRTEFGRK
ncbi:hypothetical protein [Pseudonocardia sp. MH-G8]|uniref:hypothetical protein n=1 Tax=Pseudonocardia sp. MH-G8 TaxID=1854588 RepID=UPI000BA0182B|nr:hypothetical protein [Pseudonocardia sp. MH-G8]OZM84107.1 hypothetical protein CFP66_06780 [Pseudonocardia sp. MH-G8]